MRFPGMEWMDRVNDNENYSMVSYVNSKAAPEDHIQMIPNIFATNNSYQLFNDELVYNQDTPSAARFKVLSSDGVPIPNNDRIATLSAGTALDDALQDLINVFNTSGFDARFNNLMQYDGISVREYLLQKDFTAAEIDWMETIDDATTHFDAYSLSQAVLEQWIFTIAALDSWAAVEGGMDRMTYGMTKIIKNQPLLRKRVIGLIGNSDGTVTVSMARGDQRTYAHVINTVPLGVMQNTDMSTLNLDDIKTFYCKLQYDPAGKIGMTFKTR